MGLYQAEGIVLANRDLGEADRIVTVLCREQGKVEAVARGARRPRNRLVGLTLPFNVLRMSLFAGRSLDELSQAEAIVVFRTLREDLCRLAYASYLSELTSEFLPEREPQRAVFELLLQGLMNLEAGHDPESIARYHELCLLDLAGFRPALDGCLRCGRIPDGALSFSAPEGGLYCQACAPRGADCLPLSRPALEAMRRGLAEDYWYLRSLSPADRTAIQRILRVFIESRLDRQLRSLAFLSVLLGEADEHP